MIKQLLLIVLFSTQSVLAWGVEPAHVPGFQLPTEWAVIDGMQELCRSAQLVESFRTCDSAEQKVVEFYENDRLLGQLKGAYSSDGVTAFVDLMQVHDDARGRGLSIHLFRKFIELGGASVSKVAGQLAFTNMRAVLEEYYAISTPGSPRYNANLTREQANLLSVQASPFARALRQLGFSRIELATIEWVTINGPPYVAMIQVVIAKGN